MDRVLEFCKIVAPPFYKKIVYRVDNFDRRIDLACSYGLMAGSIATLVILSSVSDFVTRITPDRFVLAVGLIGSILLCGVRIVLSSKPYSERKLRQWKDWKDEGRLSQKHYEDILLAWAEAYRDRLFPVKRAPDTSKNVSTNNEVTRHVWMIDFVIFVYREISNSLVVLISIFAGALLAYSWFFHAELFLQYSFSRVLVLLFLFVLFFAWPVRIYVTSGFRNNRQFKRLEAWKKDELITEEIYDIIMDSWTVWYIKAAI